MKLSEEIMKATKIEPEEILRTKKYDATDRSKLKDELLLIAGVFLVIVSGSFLFLA